MLKKLLFAALLLFSCAAQAVVYSSPFSPKPQFVDANGAPMSSGTLQTFTAGSSTPLVTYTDSTGGVANPTTITLNTRGESPNEVWLTGGLLYKFVLKDSSGVTIWTVDNIKGINDTTTAFDEWIASTSTPTYVSGTSFTMAGDQTPSLIVGRRVKFTVSAGTVYGTIATSLFGALTTVTMTMDAAQVLDNGLSSVSLGILRPTNVSIPNFITAGSGISISYSSGKPAIAASGQATVNGLINGGMEVWQRGTSISVAASSNGYGPDRWALTTGANQASTMTQATGLTSASQWAVQVQRTAAQTGTGVMVFEQPFELGEIIKWRGQTISVSASIATGANWSPTSGTITMTIAAGTGAAARRGNAPYTGETQPLVSSFNIAAGAAAASYSATATSVIPTTTTQMTLMITWTPVGTAGAADTFTIDDVMFSAAAGAAFERRLMGQEIALCQRYFFKTFLPATTPAQNVGLNTGELRWSSVNASTFFSTTLTFPVQMRTTPTITLFNPSAANAQARNISLGADGSATTAANPTQGGVFVGATDNVGGAQGNSMAVHVTAAAEL